MTIRVDYWIISGGISQQDAAAIVSAEGFAFELGRISRFENARNAVVIAKADLLDGLVNRVLLAEELQHGHDRLTHEAAKAIQRRLSNNEFHTEVFERVLSRYRSGNLTFLTDTDIEGLHKALKELRL